MNDTVMTQLGLTVVYTAVGALVTLTERVERSKALRIWSFAFYMFSIDALASALRDQFHLTSLVVASWLSLTAAGVLGVAGAVTFIGRPIPKGLFALGGLAAIFTFSGLGLGIDSAWISAVVFLCIGVSFLWAARLIYESGVPHGIGRWVACSAFAAAGLYATSWPLLCQLDAFRRLEFYLDLSCVMWGAAGVLLIHFERSRTRLHEMVLKERELRAQLERSERLEALGRLAGGVAHDFNNVLTTVIHGSELTLRQLQDRPETAAHVETVLEAARGAATFTRQLLAFGRRRLPGRKPTLVDQAIHGALSMVRPSLMPNHALVCPTPDPTLAVLAGEGQIEQILVNLSLNAITAMPDGGTLTLAVDAPAEQIRLTVRDTGCGMGEDTLNRVFEPFFTTRSAKGGTGLGLAAVYAIVTQLDGQIQVESTPGIGSCFTVDLKRCPPPQPAQPRQTRASRPPSSIHVLVVDDQESVLRSISAGLVGSGYRVTTAASAREALDRMAHLSPTLMLVDVRMPKTTGLELLEQVRLRYPTCPVIMMTGHANDEELESGKYGAHWLLKPFTPEKLTEAINTALAS